MSELVKFSKANLPTAGNLAQALRASTESISNGDSVILKMDKTGHWVFGADQTEIEDDSKWAINPYSFVHGHIAWGDGEVLAERMGPITEPLPALEAAPPGAKRGWETQIGMSVKCMNGEDEEMEARYAVTSVGGKRAMSALATAIAAQVERDPTKPVAVVTLANEHYQHKSYGRIYTPVFNIVEWTSMDGSAADKPAEEPVADDTSTRRRRRKV